MSDQPKEPKIIDLEVFSKDATVQITVDFDLYVRLQQFLLDEDGPIYKDKEEFFKNLKLVKEGKADKGLAYHLQTILRIILLIEDAGKSSGKFTKSKFDLTKGQAVTQ